MKFSVKLIFLISFVVSRSKRQMGWSFWTLAPSKQENRQRSRRRSPTTQKCRWRLTSVCHLRHQEGSLWLRVCQLHPRKWQWNPMSLWMWLSNYVQTRESLLSQKRLVVVYRISSKATELVSLINFFFFFLNHFFKCFKLFQNINSCSDHLKTMWRNIVCGCVLVFFQQNQVPQVIIKMGQVMHHIKDLSVIDHIKNLWFEGHEKISKNLSQCREKQVYNFWFSA